MYFLIASITGGAAGPIVARGRKDRSIWANGIIGFGGWAGAWLVARIVDRVWPEELTLGLGLLALLISFG
jgi:hypothetical protein